MPVRQPVFTRTHEICLYPENLKTVRFQNLALMHNQGFFYIHFYSNGLVNCGNINVINQLL